MSGPSQSDPITSHRSSCFGTERLSAVAVAIWVSACPRWFLIEPQATQAPVKACKSHQIATKAGAFDGSNNVRFGSKGDMCAAKGHVCFGPISRYVRCTTQCLLWADCVAKLF